MALLGQDGGRLPDADDALNVKCAGSQAVLLPTTSDLRDRTDRASSNVEGTDAFGAVDLVAGKGGEIDAKVVDMERKGTKRLSGIGVQQDAVFTSDLADLGERLDSADLIVGVHDRHKYCPGRDCRRDIGRVDKPIGFDRDDGYLKAFFGEVLAAGEDGLVLDGGGNDVEAFALKRAGDAGDGKVVGFGSAGGEHDFGFRASPDQFAELVAGNADSSGGLTPVGVQARP